MSHTNRLHQGWYKKVGSAIVLSLALPCAANAAEVTDNTALAPQDHRFLCTLAGEERFIDVDYSDNSGLPCSVEYQKEGERKRLWQARHQVNFCAQKAQTFIANLESHGWQCGLDLAMPATQGLTPDQGISPKNESDAATHAAEGAQTSQGKLVDDFEAVKSDMQLKVQRDEAAIKLEEAKQAAIANAPEHDDAKTQVEAVKSELKATQNAVKREIQSDQDQGEQLETAIKAAVAE